MKATQPPPASPLSMRDVCRALGCSRRHFYRLAEAGDKGVRYLLARSMPGLPGAHRKWQPEALTEALRLRESAPLAARLRRLA